MLLALAVPTADARADLPSVERTLTLGRPRRPVRVKLAAQGAVTLRAAGTTRKLPAVNASEITLDELAIGADAAIGLLRVTAENGHWVGLLGGRSGSELVWFEREDPLGDPGERRSRVVEVTRDPVGVRTGLRFEGMSLCGVQPWLFDERTLDPSSLRLIEGRTPPRFADPSELAVSRVTGESPPPVLDALAPVASSELDPDTQLPRAPRALVATPPSPGLSLARSAAVAVFRWEGGPLPIERLELEVVGTAPQALSLWWLDDQGTTRHATIAVEAGGGRFTLTPASPRAGTCVAVYAEAPSTSGRAAPLALRGLRAYTALDRPGGVDRLIAWLVQDDKRAAEASSLLARLGPVGAAQLASRWDALSPQGKRRGLKVLARHLELASAARCAEEAARSDDAALSGAAIAMLVRSESGRAVLRELAQTATPAGDRAADALARAPDAAPALLRALAQPHGDDRVQLREAIARSMRHDFAAFERATATWLAAAPPTLAIASLAVAAARAEQPDLVAALADAHASKAERFEDRYRFAVALREARESAAASAWLEREARDAPEWMQRREAFGALVEQHAARAEALARVLARDPYPRVRASALATLMHAGERASVEASAARDHWPLVRAAAIEALATDPASTPVVTRALDDAAESVRKAAIESLTSLRATDAWPHVRTRLELANEPLAVRAAAIAYARTLCIARSREVLRGVAERAHAPGAHEADQQLGVEALRALHALGGDAARDGAAIVERAGEPALTALWSRLPRSACEKRDK